MLRFRTLVLPLVWFVLAGLSLNGATQSSPAPAATATTPRFPTNEDLRHLKALSSPMLSPDGKQVLFTLTHATADGAASHLWIVPASATERRQSPANSPSLPPPTSAASTTRSGRPTTPPSFF